MNGLRKNFSTFQGISQLYSTLAIASKDTDAEQNWNGAEELNHGEWVFLLTVNIQALESFSVLDSVYDENRGIHLCYLTRLITFRY